MNRLRSANARMYLIVVDQAVSGASNILVGLIAAHMLGLGAFGLFTLLLFVYAFALAIPSGLVSQPFLVHPEDADERAGEGIGSTLMVSAVVGLGCSAVGLVGLSQHWVLAWPFVILGICLPLMLLQDFGRFLSFAIRRPERALILDLLWLVLEIAAFVALVLLHKVTLTTFVAGWAATGALAGLWVFWQCRGSRPVFAWHWLRSRWSYAWRSALVSTTTLGAVVLGSFALLVVASDTVVGAVRGALLLIRPYQIVQQALTAAGTTDVAREDPAGALLDRRVMKLSTQLGLLGAVDLVVLAFLPDSIGRLGLGSAWSAVAPIVAGAAVQALASGLASGPRAALLGKKAIGITMRLDIGGVLLSLASMLTGSVLDDAAGAIWGATLGTVVMLPLYWIAYMWVRRTAQPAVPV